MAQRETDLMRQIEIDLCRETAGRVKVFRTNVGEFWTGQEIIRTDGGGVYIPKAYRFDTGLPKGFSDLFAVVPTVITPELLGRTLAQAAFIEVKTPTGRLRPEQEQFLAVMRATGARAGVARSPEDAIRIVTGAS